MDIQDRLARLKTFMDLNEGWLDAESVPPNIKSMVGAFEIIEFLDSQGINSNPGVFPEASGGIQLEWNSPAIEIVISNTGSVSIFILDEEESIFSDITLDDKTYLNGKLKTLVQLFD